MSVIIPLPVTGLTITGTVTVNVANTPNVVVANTSPIGVNVANTPSVSVSGTVSVNVANTPNVNVANTPNVVVTNSAPLNVNVANTPSVSVSGTASVLVQPQQFSFKTISGTTSATAGALTQLTTTSTLAHGFIVVSGSSSSGVDVYATNNNKALLGFAVAPSGANARVVYYDFRDNVVDLSTIYITGDGTATSVPYTVIYW